MMKSMLNNCAIALLGMALAQDLHAEGSHQIGLDQSLLEYGLDIPNELSTPVRPLYVDIIKAGEVINLAVCGNSDSDVVRVEMYAPSGAQVENQALGTAINATGRVACADPFSTPLATPLRHTTLETGAYEIRLFSAKGGYLQRFDISVTPDIVTAPDPTTAAGRLWAKTWAINTGGYTSNLASDADYFVLVPGGVADSHYVWKLDLNQFSSAIYEIVANAIGVDAPHSGSSTNRAGNSFSPEFPIYLGYPVVAKAPPTTPPTLKSVAFRDDAGVDYGISPDSTPGSQDTGSFAFTSDVEGTYVITIDADQNSIFDSDDVLLIGKATAGSNTVNWDGTDASGTPLANGVYAAKIEVRMGEYHFIANDVETSGGGTNNGLTIFQALGPTATADTRVFWDDSALLGGTRTLPSGKPSSTAAARHTWGNFTSTGFGNERYIDTYVFGWSSSTTTLMAIAIDDTPIADADVDGIPDNLDADGDNDGIPDSLEGNGAVDTDGDGAVDSMDGDSDNDGLFDLAESGADAATLDTDWDGRIDSSNTVGTNGLADAIETVVDLGDIDYDGDGAADTLRDADADGVPDFMQATSGPRTGVQGFGGCSLGGHAGFDPALPLLAAISLIYMVRGRHRAPPG